MSAMYRWRTPAGTCPTLPRIAGGTSGALGRCTRLIASHGTKLLSDIIVDIGVNASAGYGVDPVDPGGAPVVIPLTRRPLNDGGTKSPYRGVRIGTMYDPMPEGNCGRGEFGLPTMYSEPGTGASISIPETFT